MADKKYTVRFDQGSEQGVYANVVSVHLNSNEVVLDFAYKMPTLAKGEDEMLKVVSRVNMSHRSAESLLKVLSNAVLDYKNQQKKQDK